jgi:hypothetical protein
MFGFIHSAVAYGTFYNLHCTWTHVGGLPFWSSYECYCFLGGFLFCFFHCWGLNSRPTPWATPPALFCVGFFWDRVSQTISPGWLQTSILLISASWVARITGVSHWHPDWKFLDYSVKLVINMYSKDSYTANGRLKFLNNLFTVHFIYVHKLSLHLL